MIKNKVIKAALFILISALAARVWQISFLGIETIRIGFGSLFIMLGGMFLGPIYGAIIGIGADSIGFLFFPVNGMYDYLPQITVLSGLWGVLPWYLFKWRKFSIHIKDLFLILGIPQVLFNVVLMSFIISSSFGVPLMVLLSTRFIGQLVTIPVYVLITYVIFKKRESEDSLRMSEERNRAILNTLPDLMFISSRDGCYLDYHASDPNLLFIAPRHFLGKSLFEVLPEVVAELFLQSFEQAYKTNQLQIIDYSLEVGGCLRYYEARSTSIDEHRLLTIIRDITDRKEKEAEILKQKERLASILEGTNVGTWEWNTQTGEFILNERWAEIIGYTLEELAPISIETWKKYTHPDDLDAGNRILERHFTGEINCYDIECRMKHKENHWVWAHDRGKVISWAGEKPLWMFGTHQDITERKQTEELFYQQQQETHEAHQRLLMILDSLSVGINVIDMDSSEILYVSNYTRSSYHEDIIGKICWQVFQEDQTGPCDFCTNAQLVDATGKPKGLIQYDFYNEKEGKWYECRDVAIDWIDGRIVRLEMALDITERKQMEEQLRENEERIKHLSNNLPNSMFYQVDFGEDGLSRKFTYVSAGVERIHGVTASEAIRDCSAIYGQVFEEDLLLLSKREAECMANMSTFQLEFRVRRPSGEVRWHMVSSSPRRLANNHLVWDGFEIDITERKQMEDALITSEKRLNTMMKNTPDMVVRFNKDLQHIYCNEAVERELGIPSDTFIGKSFLDLDVPGLEAEKMKLMHQFLVKCLETGNKQFFDIELMTPSGLRYYSTIIIPETSNRNIESLLAVTRDVTESKITEEKIRYQHEFQKVVAKISYNFINTPSSKLDEAINNTLYTIGTFFHVDRSYVLQFSSDDMFVSITHEWCREGIEPQINVIQNQPTDEIPWIIKEILFNEYVFIPDVSALECKEEREELQRQGIQSLLCIPIKVEKRVVGFIGMDAVIEKMAWSDEEITLLKVIGEIISSAFLKQQIELELIHRSQEVEQLNLHLNQEMEKAQRVHNNILPKDFPSIEGINFAAFYQPAETLGGDFYEVIQVDNKLVMYLSDISGHSLDGGMINFFVKEAIDSYITLKPDDITPGSILRHLERQYRRKNYPVDKFICIFLAVLDFETMELIYTGAGFQDAPLVSQGDGEQVMLSVKGLFINSAFPVGKNNFQEKTISLTKGSTIFFSTDGLTEQGEPGAYYRSKLPQVFYENAHRPPDDIALAVVEDFCQFNNGSLQGDDDITFLILQIEPDNRRHHLEIPTDFGELEGLWKKAKAILPNIKESDVIMGCLNELISNAMEHGNQMNPKKRVFLQIIVSTENIRVIVEDEGEGFNWRDKVDKPLELDGYEERGRGIAMARKLCDSLYYNDAGNKATCVVKKVGDTSRRA